MFRKFLAGFFTVIFLWVSVALVLAWGILNTFSNKDFYNDKFVDVVYEFLTVQASSFLSFEDFPLLDEGDTAELFTKIVERDDLRTVVDEIYQSVGEAKISADGTIEVNVPFKFLEGKSERIAAELAASLFEKLPKCEETSLDALDFKEMDCLSPDLAEIDLKTSLQLAIENDVLSDVPKNFHIESENLPPFDGTVAEFVSYYSYIAFLGGVLLLMLLLLLVGLIIYSPIWRVLRWEAKTIFFPSLVLFIVSISMLLFSRYFSGQLYEENLLAFGNILKLLFAALGINLLYYVAPVLVASLGLWIFSSVMESKNFDRIK